MPQRTLLLWLGCCALAHADPGHVGATRGLDHGSGAGPEASLPAHAESAARAAPASGPAPPPSCTDDTQLAEAAAELLLAGRPPLPEELTAAVRAAGSDAVGLRALFLPRVDATRRREWLAGLAEREQAPLRCGEAFGSDGALLLAASAAGGLYPVEPGKALLRGWLAEGFERPELVVADAEGQLERLPLSRRQLERGVPVADELARPARVQLVARGRFGPRPVAERVLPAGEGELDVELPVVDESLPPSRRLSALREASGVPALRENRLLSEVAGRHAADVCAQGRAAHVLEGGEDPERRMERAGLRARRVGEAVARARNTAAAFTALGQSPSHRMTLLDRSFTDVGFGERDDGAGHACVVVMLAAWPRYVGR